MLTQLCIKVFRCLSVLIAVIFPCKVLSQKLHVGPVSFPVSYKSEVMSNLMGGIAQGTEYLGYGTIGVGFDTEKAKLWEGGFFYIEGATTHGGSPSIDYIGDVQVASNIEAGNHVYLQKLHFHQQVGDFYTKIGLLDYNDDFAICGSAKLFHNNSFGVHSVLSYNFNLPSFPVTGLGFIVGYDINEHWNVQAGIYDGGPIPFELDNPYNVNWQLDINKGYLVTSEVQFKYLRGCYNVCAYYHTGEESSGFSLSVDQNILETDMHKLNGFLYTAVAAPWKEKILNFNVNSGLRLDGVFSRRMRDSAGIGCAVSCFLDGLVETAIELVYTYRVGSWLSIEPDLQYIINPSGDILNNRTANALVTSLRLVINL